MGILEKANEIYQILKGGNDFLIVSHADADGVAGAGIAITLLNEMDIDYEMEFVNQIEDVKKYRGNKTIFIDVGNSNVEEIKKNGIDAIVIDHHMGNFYFSKSLNPFFYGIDGSTEISAAGLVHLVARNLNMGELAIIGAIGDMQEMKGWNRKILMKSSVEIKRDIRTYGRNMPLYRMLSFSPLIPPLFRNVGRTIKFLKDMGIDWKEKWIELDADKKKKILSGVVKMMVRRGYERKRIFSIYGEVYELNGRDVREIAAMINSMAKYGRYKEAIYTCTTGDYRFAEKFIDEHRKNIKNGIKIARDNLNDAGRIKYFHAGNKIRDAILGTITGMLLESERMDKPLVGFAETDGKVKVSARIPRDMNINIGRAIRAAASRAGGSGGGHRMAAGAIIPRGFEDEFLKFFEIEITRFYKP